MKTLYLLRHATPVSGVPGQRDEERPLDEKGRQETAAVARILAASPGARPVQKVLCSSAKRTLDTLDGLRPSLGDAVEEVIDDGLYCASQGELLEHILSLSDACDGVLVIAHNPGIAALAVTLARAGDPALRGHLRYYPPAAMAVIDFDVERWADITARGGTLVAF